MEDDLRTGSPYRISCLRQQPSGVDRRCQIWPIRGYTRFWYTGTASFEKISQAFPRPLPQSPLVFSRFSLALVFARAPLSERLEQATVKTTLVWNKSACCCYRQPCVLSANEPLL